MDELGNELIVGRDLAYATEGLLGPGLTRWENYIAAAETAGELLTQTQATRRDSRSRSQRRAQNLDRIAESKKISDQDLEVERAALVAAHESRVRDALGASAAETTFVDDTNETSPPPWRRKRAHARRHRRNLAANAQTR